MIEALFDDDTERRDESLKQIIQAASIGAELFSNEMIDFLLEQSLAPEYGAHCLSICAKLAPERKDYNERFTVVALEAIRREVSPETAAELLVANLAKSKLPPEARIPQVLIAWQSYYIPIGGLRREPAYPFSTEILVTYYEIAPELVRGAIRERLQSNDKRTRCDACGVIKAIRVSTTKFVVDLLPELINSLTLDDDPYEDSADSAACHEIAAAFTTNPEAVERDLCSRINASAGELQKLLILPYRIVLRDNDWRPSTSDGAAPIRTPSSAQKLAFARCFQFLRDDRLELETRLEAAEALEHLPDSLGELTLTNFDVLLGCLALMCVQAEPPKPPPHIIIPGQETAENAHAGFDEWKRKEDWQHLRGKITNILERLSKKYPERMVDPLIQCFEQTNTKSHEQLKAELLVVLGHVGRDYSCQPKVVPILMKGLMDYDSVFVRARAVQAVEETFRYSNAHPPENMLDVLVLHLRDQYVAVHKSALQFVRFHASALNDLQKIQALQTIAVHARVYKNQPLDLDAICAAALAVSARNDALRRFALKLIKSFFPTGEELADESIAESLARSTKPTYETAPAVAEMVLWAIKNGRRDRFNSYDYQKRNEYFRWLKDLPAHVCSSINASLMDAALRLASDDPWESCLFSELFAKLGDFQAEAQILERASKSTEGEKSLEGLHGALETLRQAALANAEKCNGDVAAAARHLNQIAVKEE